MKFFVLLSCVLAETTCEPSIPIEVVETNPKHPSPEKHCEETLSIPSQYGEYRMSNNFQM